MSAPFAGTLTEQVELRRPTGERDSLGLQQAGWEAFARCRANIVQEGFGSESEAQALSAMPRFRVIVRRRDGVAIGQRVQWKARLLTIRQINDEPRWKDRLILRCEEVRQ